LSNYSNYGSKNLIYLKKAPDWMNCYDGDGDFSNNNLDCYNYALECTSNDVGCDIYTPTNGEPPVPGVVYETDYCPAECVGYQLFKEMPTYFDSGQDNVDLIPLIPDTAKTCPASEVGCSEFTNLDLVLQGGEGLEYYTYLRQCVKTNENNQPISPQPVTHEENVTCKYYYTWVGSETTGYQLKRYYLKSNANGSPAITNESEGICSESDMATNPHCKQFYDKAGNVYYAIYEYTITCSPDCHPYRKTISNETDCLASGGTWKNNNCYYLAIPSQGRRCSAANVNCHEYKGSAANNVRQIIFDDFETDEQLGKWTGGTISSESINFGGHSLKVTGSASRNVSNLVFENKSYLLSFWAKGKGDYSVKFKGKDEDNNDIEISFGSVSVSSDEWQEIKMEIKMGPVYVPSGSTINNLNISGPLPFYLDNVSLKEVSQDLYLIKGSWKIPETCTLNDIGCQAYKNSAGELYYLKSFNHLCSEDKVGCEALIDTQNSSSPFAQEFNTENINKKNDDIKVSKDEIIYLVNNKNKSCRPEDKGCQKFGLPKITDGSITAWTDVYFKNDPDKYNLKPTICQADDLGCEAYVDLGSGSPVYFKDPKDKLCEWRDNVILPGNAEQTISGWFKKGTDQPCYYNEDGTAHYGIYQSTGEFYDGSVGLCPTEQSGCKVFAEPGATEGDNLIKNGDFSAGEDSWTVVGNTVGGDTGIEEDNGNKYLKVVAGGQCQAWKDGTCTYGYVYGARQEVDVNESQKIPGASYRLLAKVKLPESSLANEPSICVRLQYQGYKDLDELVAGLNDDTAPEDFAECYNKDDPKGEPVCKNEDGSHNNIFPEGSEEQAFVDCVWNTYSVHPDNGPEYEWCWNQKHFYRNEACLSFSNKELQQGSTDWIRKQRIIIAGGETNPKNLPIEKVSLWVFIVGWSRGQATGEMYVDDIELRPIENYYYLDNERLDRTSCQGRVSQKEGCILFLDKSLKDSEGNVLTTYNSLATYKKSKEAANNGFVNPVDCSNPIDCEDGNNKNKDYCKYCQPYGLNENDTNTILKVQRDRICGQWLSCISSHSVWDKQLGKYEEVCDAYMRCDKLTGSGSGARCTHFINEPDEILDEKKYKERDVSWSGMDYSGLSISNMLPVERMEPILTNSTYGIYKLDIDGDNTGDIEKTVRAYPEAESPYQDSVKEYYSNVNTCITGEGGDQNYQNCQGWYTKATYGNTYTFYYQKGITPPDAVYTDTGEKANSCNVASGSTIGTDPNNRPCALLTKKTTAIGLRGFCLEPDKTKPDDINACITWWPGSATGDIDVNQYYTSAGYIPTRRYYGVGEKEADSIVFNLGSFPDMDDSGDDICNTAPNYMNNYEKGYKLEGTTKTFTYNLDDNSGCIGAQNSAYCHPVLSNLPFDMVDRIEIHYWTDFGGLETDCGQVNDESNVTKTLTEDETNKRFYGPDTASTAIFTHCGGTDGYGKVWVNFNDNGIGLKNVEIEIKEGGCADGPIWVYIKSIKIYLKPGAEKILEVSDSPAIAFTNRVNNVGRNFYGDSIDGKTIDSPCSPWGAIGGVNFVNGKPYYVYENEGCGDGIIDPDSIYSSEDEIKDNLFPKYEKYAGLGVDSLSYVVYPDVDETDNTSRYKGPPHVASVSCDESGKCDVWHLDDVTIGKTDRTNQGGKFISVKAPYTAVLKFYAWANKDQMPIREIAVDWKGDGTEIQKFSNLMAKNHKPKCCESNNSCNNISAGSNETVYDSAGDATPYLNFGNIPDACTPKYFLLAHTYTEPGTYTPKVYIKDNWGWCNGNVYAGDNKSCAEKSGAGTSGPRIEVE